MGNISLTAAVVMAMTAVALSGCGKTAEQVGPKATEKLAPETEKLVPDLPKPAVHVPTPHIDLPDPRGTLGNPDTVTQPSLALAKENIPAMSTVPYSDEGEVLKDACRVYDFYEFVLASPDKKWRIVEKEFHVPATKSHEISEVASNIRDLIVRPTWRGFVEVTPETICLAG
jgi:hypothetical protein